MWVAASLALSFCVMIVVVVLTMTVDAVLVVLAVANLRKGRLFQTHTGPEMSSKDQCHAHDS